MHKDFKEDYLDADVAYLLGMMVARGERLSSAGVYRLIIHIPKGSLVAEGISTHFVSDTEIRLGIEEIRERILELLDCDVRTADAGSSWDLVATMNRATIAWRDIAMILEGRSSFTTFQVPAVLKDPSTPREFKREFLRGFADVAGNIRPANRDQNGRHRVRLDVLNYKGNWRVPVDLCLLLQQDLEVPVPVITWGHPNLGRDWREHQINIYAEDFEAGVGFSFPFKQTALHELAEINRQKAGSRPSGCPGRRQFKLSRQKPSSPLESNTERQDDALVGKHFDAYWQICKALGCPREPASTEQIEMELPEE